ncbi:MAG: alpha/beta hydrolase [Anaerolineales bacterium]|nr:alpha/beta hydrolase [Anaerolineales bacterium]
MSSSISKLPRWLVAVLLILLLVVAGFYLWAMSPPQPMPEALRALNPIQEVSITETESGWWVYESTLLAANQGLILYPGNRIDPRAYAPLARDLAANGYLVVVPRMPFNFAFFNKDVAADIQAAYPEISGWALGGHYQGGAVAAEYAANHPNDVTALILWAATPPEDVSLTTANYPITIIYGSEDGLVPPAKVEASRNQFPATAEFIEIAGGNHAQFVWSSPPANDNEATITRQDQTGQIIAATVQTLRRSAP